MLRHHHNHARYQPGQRKGHYESFWQRANHPTRPLSFWIRYTLFSPHGEPDKAIGELWAIWSDGEQKRLTAAKSEFPITACRFSRDAFDVEIGDSSLDHSRLFGAAESGGHRILWDLHYTSPQPPLFHLPLKLYEAALPKAKSLVGSPLAAFQGSVVVDGETMPINGWVGSQNHNWGARHTDHYAYGQVAGFDNAPQSFLEIATARIRVGPLWTPFMTPLVLRHQGEEFAINALSRAVRAKADFRYFDWHFSSETPDARIEGRIHAAREDFVGLRYYNPPGGVKCCLNSKIAACELTLVDRRRGRSAEPQKLVTAHRAAFEILTDDHVTHDVEIRA
jgi:hypothetical protein